MITEDERKKRIASLLDHEIKSRDWNGSDLARHIGISRDCTNRYLRGASVPSAPHAQLISKKLGIDLLALVGDGEIEAPARTDSKLLRNGNYQLAFDREVTSRQLAAILAILNDE